MNNKTPVYNCVKCGAQNTMTGMEAANNAMPGAKVRMIRCVCSKCGFTEFRVDHAGFSSVMNAKEDEEKKD